MEFLYIKKMFKSIHTNDLLSIIDGTKPNSSATNITLQRAWKIWNNEVQLDIMFNLGDI